LQHKRIAGSTGSHDSSLHLRLAAALVSIAPVLAACGPGPKRSLASSKYGAGRSPLTGLQIKNKNPYKRVGLTSDRGAKLDGHARL
jgi:hypothetical protein